MVIEWYVQAGRLLCLMFLLQESQPQGSTPSGAFSLRTGVGRAESRGSCPRILFAQRASR